MRFLLKFAISLVIFSNGCAIDKYAMSKTNNNGSEAIVYEKPSEGMDNLTAAIGVAIILGTVYAVAPKEAYR